MQLSIRTWIDIAMGLVIVALLVVVGFSRAEITVLKGSNKTMTESLAATAEERKAAVESSANWKTVAVDLGKKLESERAQVTQIKADNVKALASATAAERDATATLHLWMTRYAAPKSKTCAELLAQPLNQCPELLE